MKQIYSTLFLLLFFNLSLVTAQDRYLDDVFTGVEVTSDITYGQNISILTGAPELIELKMNVYAPAGDDNTERPVMLVAHTGNFLPAYFNGGITGGLQDSVVVETCRRLVKKGYVAAAFTYRQGWLPLAPDQDTRTGTLLQAAYRGIQDARTAVRYLRKSVAEDENPYGIDPDKIGMWGIGTGGYVSLGAATLDDYEEVLLDKFLNSQTLEPLADTLLLGNFYGTTDAPLCVANYPGYSSDFSICINVGGALGDISWLDGKDSEPAFVGYHSTGDVFAPFGDGPVIVPTTGQFVVNVSGTNTVITNANALGNNDVLSTILPEYDIYADYINALKAVELTFQGGFTTNIGEDHMYTFVQPPPIGSPWNWWDKNTLDVIIPFVNMQFGTTFSSDTLHLSGLITNPNMSPENAKPFLDTMMNHFAPRGCLALGLGCLVSDVDEIKAEEIGFKVYPNPISDQTTIELNPAETIEKLYLYSLDGKLVQARTHLNTNKYILKRNQLTSGVYYLRIHTDKGIMSTELMFR